MIQLFKDPLFNTLDSVFDRYRYNDYPDVKIKKSDSNYKLLMSIPGLCKDDLKIVIKDGILKISYEKEEKNENSYFMTSFEKSYTLPDDINDNEIQATVKDGVLQLILPFHEKKFLEKVISIE